MLLQNKVALVTDSGSGIGRATALSFASDGAKVVVAGRDGESAEKVAAEVSKTGAEAIAIRCDVAIEEQVAAMVATTVAYFGRMDCASNNAALGGGFSRIPDVDASNWERIQNVTLKGVWPCLNYQIPAMLAAGSGSIVNITALSGVRGEALQIP